MARQTHLEVHLARRRLPVAIGVAFLVLVLLPAYAHAATPQTYAVTDIGDLSQRCAPQSFPFPPTAAGATALNNLGEVVGWARYYCADDGSFTAIAWSDGTLREIGFSSPFFNGFLSAALAVNDAGVAVGWGSIDAFDGHDALIFPPGSPAVNIGALAYGGPWCVSGSFGCEFDAWSEATNINNRGEVVGLSTITPQDPLFVRHAFYYYEGKLYDNQAGLLGGPQRTIGTNTWGQTVSGRTVGVGYWDGSSGDPTLTRDGVVTHLNSVVSSDSGLTLIDAADINDRGQIAGTAATTDCAPGWGCLPAAHPYLLTDESPPSCALSGSGTNTTGQRYVTFALQDTLSGLKSITAPTLTNATMTLPAWNTGTPRQVMATVTKQAQSTGSLIKLQATDIAGNTVNCDPTLMLSRIAGTPDTQTVTDLTADQHVVTITNGTPGIENLVIAVNGKTVERPRLGDGQTRTIVIGAALSSGHANNVSFTTLGKPGGSALVVISGS